MRENANDNMLKRGIARSSIATGNMDALDASHLQSASDAESAYSKAVANINDSIAKLERDKDTTLGELDLKYAVELEEKSTSLKPKEIRRWKNTRSTTTISAKKRGVRGKSSKENIRLSQTIRKG